MLKGPAFYFLGGLVAGGVFLSLYGEQLHNLVLVGTVSKGRIGDALRSCVEISEEYPTSTKEELRDAPVTRHCERRSKQAAPFCGSSLVPTLV